MEDHVFGTYVTDDLKLNDHRLKLGGVRHANRISPLDPTSDRAVSLTVEVGMNLHVSQVACYYTIDGSEPVGSRGQATNGKVLMLHRADLRWDTLAWAYVTTWEGDISPQPEGSIVTYIISAWAEGDAEYLADFPDVKRTGERFARSFFTGEVITDARPISPLHATVFNYHIDDFTVPQWAQDAIIYQIFVDRFYPGDGKDWQTPDSLSGFFGGTLWGVRDKLDYIADLGINCIWLTPIFESPSHHGYDALDYKKVEPRLGGDEALRVVVEGAHQRGIKVLLDFACNHISSEHPIFKEALNNPDSQYRDWFTFDDSDIGYRTFFGVATLAEINVASAGANAFLLDIAQYWIREFDIDGYRLDYAHGPGPNFWTGFRKAIRDVKADSLCFGEIVEIPEIQRVFAGRLDGALDFYISDNLRKLCAYETISEGDFKQLLEAHQRYFPEDFVLPVFLDNHDMNRFLYSAQNDKSKLKRALKLLFSLPNPPIIYYGTEVGLSQETGTDQVGLEASRLPMLWGDDQDTELLALVKDLIRQRKW